MVEGTANKIKQQILGGSSDYAASSYPRCTRFHRWPSVLDVLSVFGDVGFLYVLGVRGVLGS
jgi:hypothetical protein